MHMGETFHSRHFLVDFPAVFFIFVTLIFVMKHLVTNTINSQSLKDTQVGYISRKYTLDITIWKNTLLCGEWCGAGGKWC